MEWLQSIGLNEKQRKLYLHLLEHGGLTASQLATELGEQRTNIYLLVDALIALGLVEKDETNPVAQFKVTNPQKLQDLMLARQRSVATHSAQMKHALPELLGLFHLNTSYDGMAYFEGLKGYEAALEEMNKITDEVRVFAASEIQYARLDAWDVLIRQLTKRASLKIKTRILFEKSLKGSTRLSVNHSPLLQRYMKAGFWGDSLFDGEIALYNNAVVLTSYDEKLVSLIIKNSAIATTFKAIFDTAWVEAEKP